MKITAKTTGQIEIDIQKDLFPILKEHFKEKHGYDVTKLQRNDAKIVMIFEMDQDGGARPMNKPVREKIERASNEGHRKQWTGIYEAIGDIVDTQRKRKKSFISFDDLYEELMGVAGPNGKPKFEKDGVKIEKSRVRQYCAPSQIVRQAKGQPNLKGVKSDRKKGGLVF